MCLRGTACVAVLLALAGCDRLGKTGRQAATPAPMRTSPPQVAETVDPPQEAPDPSLPAEETPPSVTPPPETTPAESPPAPASATLILYEDSFADVAGSVRRKTDGKQQPGEGPPASRTIYTFQDVPVDGVLTMRIFEDNITAGPDGKPGVLALAWDEIPKKLAWSGFPYLGGTVKRMTIPKLQAARSVDDLRGLRLKFSYRGVNASSASPREIQVNCRLEPVVNDSFKHRIDFGTLVATAEWQNFDLSLADGKNVDAFLKMLAADNPASFKIVWGQSVPIEKYRAGDTLQIDDISVMSVPVPSGE